MKPINKLGLYSTILPAMEIAAKRDNEDFAPLQIEYQLGVLEDATIFDCRQLPWDFVADTGEAAFHEAEQTKQIVRLPFTACYFELYDEELGTYGIFAFEDDCSLLNLEGVPNNPEMYCVELRLFHLNPELDARDCLHNVFYRFSNGIRLPIYGADENEPVPFMDLVNDPGDDAAYFGNPEAKAALFLERNARLFFGILALLNEKLVATEIKPDPSPQLTKARIKRGKRPVSGETRVLTVNVSAVRNAVSRAVKEGLGRQKHESPCLHWRRGHWRVLHRGSEFESKTWVKKCLVGDPSKGYHNKSYKLIQEPPMVTPIPSDQQAIFDALWDGTRH